MKKHFLVFLNASLSLVAFAQQLPVDPFSNHSFRFDKFSKAAIQAPQLSILYDWDSPNDNWKAEGDSLFITYDGLGNILSRTFVYSQPHSPSQSRIDYTYDNNSRMTSLISVDWNELKEIWEETFKTEYRLSINEDSSEQISYFKQNNDWIRSNSYLKVKSFQASKTVSIQYFQSENELNRYQILSQTEFVYQNDTVIEIVYKNWDSIQNSFIKKDKLSNIVWFKYNKVDPEDSRFKGGLYSRWNGISWIQLSRFQNKFNLNGDLTEENNETFRDTSWVLTNSLRHYLSYNNENTLIEEITEFLKDGVYENRRKIVHSNFTLVNSQDNIEPHGNVKPLFYPNPAQTTLHLNHPIVGEYTVKLSSLSGKLLVNVNSEAQKITLDRSQLPSGLYLYQIILPNGETSTGKILLND